MKPAAAFFIGNVIAGVHSALIVFFFVGWLIPFTSFLRRCLINLAIGSAFLTFWLIGWCPLTVWEESFKAQAGILRVGPDEAFVARQLFLFGISIDIQAINHISLYLIGGVLTLALIYPGIVLWRSLRKRLFYGVIRGR